MRALIQRVNFASIKVDEKEVSKIDKGLLVFVGFTKTDTDKDLEYILKKVKNIRIFEDENFKMNLSVIDKKYEILIVSQFTLYGDCTKGNRPSFDKSLGASEAKVLYDKFLKLFEKENISIKSGIFQADMKIALENDGPVTIQLDSNRIY